MSEKKREREGERGGEGDGDIERNGQREKDTNKQTKQTDRKGGRYNDRTKKSYWKKDKDTGMLRNLLRLGRGINKENKAVDGWRKREKDDIWLIIQNTKYTLASQYS